MKRILFLITVMLTCAVGALAQVNSQRVIYTASNPPTACVAGKYYSNPSLNPAKAWVGTSAGTCTEIDASAAAPANATYITETANSTLTNEFALASLATGILKNTTTTGVPSIAVAGDFPTLNQNTSGTASNLSGTPALPNGTTGTTQSASDNSTKLATTQYVDSAVGVDTPPFVDTTSIVKGSADATKLLRFEVDGFTAGTTRVLTPPNFDGVIATLAGTEEFTNKTLNASVGKGTWTASGTWTLPAFTLNGTISGGGNDLNNTRIGNLTPLAGSFTTGNFSSTLAAGSTTITGLVTASSGAVLGGATGMDIGFNNLGGTLAAGQSLGITASASVSVAKDTRLFRVSAGLFGLGTSDDSTVNGGIKSGTYLTGTNCSDSAGAAACGSAAAGSFVIDAAATTVVVSTTAVTANSQIFVQEDSSLGTRLSVTCNTQSVLVLGSPVVTARTAGTSFTVAIVVGPTANPACYHYHIVN